MSTGSRTESESGSLITVGNLGIDMDLKTRSDIEICRKNNGISWKEERAFKGFFGIPIFIVQLAFDKVFEKTDIVARILARENPRV